MSQESRQALLLVLGGLATAGGVATLALWPRPKALPSSGWQTFSGAYTEADVEAGARMLASENPRGSKQLHIEQVFTQLRARKPGQSLFDRITAGSGWGRQGERQGSGGVRPVSTDQPANDSQRQLVREILEGTYASQFLGARQFFEPGQQDKALAIGDRARQKLQNGEPLTEQEKRLIHYDKSAEQVRKDWIRGGSKFIGVREGIEFYS